MTGVGRVGVGVDMVAAMIQMVGMVVIILANVARVGKHLL